MRPGPAVSAFDVADAQVLNALSQFAAHGVRVNLYSHRRFPAGFFSRHAERRNWAPDPADFDEFSAWLRQQLLAGTIECVLPTSDLIVFHCALLRDLFPHAQAERLLDPAEVQRALFKPHFHRVCEAAGVAVPQTLLPRSLDEARTMAAQIGYPLLVKPKSHVGIGTAYRGTIVETAAELDAAFRPLPIAPEWQRHLAHWPDLEWPMLQKYLPSAKRRVYNASGYVDAERGLVVVSSMYKTAHFPPGIGVGVAGECCDDPRVLDATRRIAGRVIRNGLFDIEFIEDGANIVAIDFNPRLGGIVALDIARGNDLPWVWYQAVRQQYPEPQKPTPSLQWRETVPFHLGAFMRVLRGPRRLQQLAEYLRALRRPSVSAVEQADWLPRWIFNLRLFRHPRFLLRSLWNEPRFHELSLPDTPLPPSAPRPAAGR